MDDEAWLDAEVLVVKIRFKNDKTIDVAVVYRQPGENIPQVDKITRTLDLLSEPGKQLLIVGDFNFPSIDWDNLYK